MSEAYVTTVISRARDDILVRFCSVRDERDHSPCALLMFPLLTGLILEG